VGQNHSFNKSRLDIALESIKMLKIGYLKTHGGFGDSVYLYPIVKWHLARNPGLVVCSNHPEVFSTLSCKVLDYSRVRTINVGYFERKNITETNQFQDMCIASGAPPSIPYQVEFEKCKIPTFPLGNKKLCIINHPYEPLGNLRTIPKSFPWLPGWQLSQHLTSMLNVLGMYLVPNYQLIQEIINKFSDRLFYVVVGRNATARYRYTDVDVDLSESRYPKIKWLFNMVNQSDLVISQTGNMNAICEGLDKKLFVLFSQCGLDMNHDFIGSIKPCKVVTKPTTLWATDAAPKDYIFDVIREAIK